MTVPMTQHRKLYDEKIAIEIESNDFWGLRDFEVGSERNYTGGREKRRRQAESYHERH